MQGDVNSVVKLSRSEVDEATVSEAVSYAMPCVRENIVCDESAPAKGSCVDVVKMGAKRRGKNF